MKSVFISLIAVVFFSQGVVGQPSVKQTDRIRIELLRSATVMLRCGSLNLLVDPVLADVGTQPAIPFSDDRAIPLIPLPYPKERIVQEATAVLLTHYHPDHFDVVAEQLLSKAILIFCQPGDDTLLRQKGFTNVQVVDTAIRWNGVHMQRFLASHHIGATGAPPFGESSSFVVRIGEQSLFFTGDAVLDHRLQTSLKTADPDVVVANTGYCSFSQENPVLPPGVPMTLTAAELKSIVENYPKVMVVAVHMDAINHCGLTKESLRAYVNEQGLTQRIVVPEEGEGLRYEDLIVRK